MSRAELNVLGKRLQIANYRKLKEQGLVEALQAIPNIDKKMRVSWWNLHHNHVYGVVTLLGLLLTILFFLWPLAATPSVVRNSVTQYNRYGSLTLNLERRNAMQNQAFARWIDRTKVFKQRYFSGDRPTTVEFDHGSASLPFG